MSTINAHGHNGTDSCTAKLSKTDVFHVLANDRRRLLLCVLVETGPSSKRELVDAVATREYGVERVPSTERKRVHVSLIQNHLPKLEDYGVIEETRRDEYRLSVNADRVTPYLDTKSLSDRLLPFR